MGAEFNFIGINLSSLQVNSKPLPLPQHAPMRRNLHEVATDTPKIPPVKSVEGATGSCKQVPLLDAVFWPLVFARRDRQVLVHRKHFFAALASAIVPSGNVWHDGFKPVHIDIGHHLGRGIPIPGTKGAIWVFAHIPIDLPSPVLAGHCVS
jgi:hypothetical protein